MRRIFVISDLHIGGDRHPMLGDPGLLAGFLEQVADYRRLPGEKTELVVNGDFIDFLALAPHQRWTPDEGGARTKLNACFRQFPAVFDALTRAANRVDYFTILLGNHDIELAYPAVLRELLGRLGTNEHRCLFIGDNRAYRVGDLHIEHGNRYDSFNSIDYDGLRHVVSAASRGDRHKMEICPGSELVERMVAPLKEEYPFIDLLKPETKILPLLLVALEPSKLALLQNIMTFAETWWGQFGRLWEWRVELHPTRDKYISGASYRTGMPKKLVDDFPEVMNPRQGSAAGDGVAGSMRQNRPIPQARLVRVQTALLYALDGDHTFEDDSTDGPYFDAAQKLTAAAAADGWAPPKVVIMGHTHAVRNKPTTRGLYLNTGTWVDMIRPTPDILEPSDVGRSRLSEWLTNLLANPAQLRSRRPCFADITLADDGTIAQPAGREMLRDFSSGVPCFP